MMSKEASSRTASGIGTITASSSAVRYTLSQACWLVCLKPVSPFTQYAVGSMSSTGIRVCLLVMLGSFRASCRNTELLGASWKMVEISCSWIRASAASLLTIAIDQNSFQLSARPKAERIAAFASAFLSSPPTSRPP